MRWLHQVEPKRITSLIETIVNMSDCVTSDRNRRVISALAWIGHTKEALFLLLLVLFSPRRRPAILALRVLLPWAIRNGAHLVVRKLLSESLGWRIREV
ncbi:hypothetical protein Gpo141_00009691 [Globisporangium polare]